MRRAPAQLSKDLSFRAKRGICFSLTVSLVCAALAVSAHAQMRGVSAGHGFPGGHPGPFHGGVFIGHRGFVSRPFRRQNLFRQPFFPLGVAVPLWWDEPYVAETEPAPPPQPVVVVVDRDDKRDQTPAPPAVPPLIIEREGDRYVQRPANYVAPAPRRPAEASNQPAPKPAVLVLRNGQQIELTDYAITTDALYDLHAGRTRKIEPSEIDVSATNKANKERGVEFTLPAPMERE